MLRRTTLALLALACAASAADSGAPSLLRQLDQGFVEVFEKVAPSVVVIEAVRKMDPEDRDLPVDKEPRGEPGEPGWPLPSHRSEGSGFIIRTDGYILTNLHVVADPEKITVRLRDGRTFTGKVIGEDETTDIAIVRIEARDLPAAKIGDSDAVRVGQLVCAIGAPFNQHFSFSVGWVSGKGRTNLLGANSSNILYEDYLQTDTFINPGNSGGPLFDVEGRVIGMNTLINGIGRGLAFAIPSSMFQGVAEQLIAHRRVQRPWLGIRMVTLSDQPALKEQAAGIDHGVVVETIEADSPAWNSQLRVDDVILDIDSVKVTDKVELLREVLKKKIGATVQLTVWRAGRTLRIPVATGELPAELTKVANLRAGKPGMEPRAESLGLRLRDARPGGAVVASVMPGSAAHRAAVQAEDVITEVAGRPVRDAGGAVAAIGDRMRTAPGKSVGLLIERKGKRSFIVVTPD